MEHEECPPLDMDFRNARNPSINGDEIRVEDPFVHPHDVDRLAELGLARMSMAEVMSFDLPFKVIAEEGIMNCRVVYTSRRLPGGLHARMDLNPYMSRIGALNKVAPPFRHFETWHPILYLIALPLMALAFGLFLRELESFVNIVVSGMLLLISALWFAVVWISNSRFHTAITTLLEIFNEIDRRVGVRWSLELREKQAVGPLKLLRSAMRTPPYSVVRVTLLAGLRDSILHEPSPPAYIDVSNQRASVYLPPNGLEPQVQDETQSEETTAPIPQAQPLSGRPVVGTVRLQLTSGGTIISGVPDHSTIPPIFSFLNWSELVGLERDRNVPQRARPRRAATTTHPDITTPPVARTTDMPPLPSYFDALAQSLPFAPSVGETDSSSEESLDNEADKTGTQEVAAGPA
ncbi:hypothetical protein M427DRAFT_130361 [Gonapodya prolifera JEL478]|uniref:Uncharacterized protein n=1 Tax=Gonapodya prolifera (strain JEL478) TaxID=1344416 RepID=A0A139AXX4_GONPJ|nr:hypothetical protein M427DRAFT_130361 [Gonapodya prolifera JEL478]|eukprot:KXS21601.1 hypothetical protein M427DRAFT_130361 [Gonapodya prolifera JEL478]